MHQPRVRISASARKKENADGFPQTFSLADLEVEEDIGSGSYAVVW